MAPAKIAVKGNRRNGADVICFGPRQPRASSPVLPLLHDCFMVPLICLTLISSFAPVLQTSRLFARRDRSPGVLRLFRPVL